MDIYRKLVTLPEGFKAEVSSFIDYLKFKSQSERPATVRKAGLAKGLIRMKEDFDEPLDDFKPYME